METSSDIAIPETPESGQGERSFTPAVLTGREPPLASSAHPGGIVLVAEEGGPPLGILLPLLLPSCEVSGGWEGALGEEVEEEEGDLSAEERAFLEEYPFLREQLEDGIRKLLALADQLDTTHRTLTRTSVVAGSIAVVSGAMSILGLVLAPATAGASLMLSAASKGLETAAGVTSILTGVWEHVQRQGARAQASSLLPSRGPGAREAGEREVSYLMAANKLVCNYGGAFRDIKKDVRALQAARAQPHLVAAAQSLQAAGRLSARKSRQVHRAFQGTPLVMTRNARLLGSVMTGFSLSLDLTALLKDWQHLKAGARTELAEELRAQAGELEGQLRELARLRDSLRQGRRLPRRGWREGELSLGPGKPRFTGEKGFRGPLRV
ncbi:apolipoprotein L6-like [Talpa occidentalis]|uniref:apolipoprotein L6-like n=1 Tax=Talpa occidentalis TaxID=50954 RepID=UPI00189002FC|nr:apolipoprotein L6-like [Talpa occidentalis]